MAKSMTGYANFKAGWTLTDNPTGLASVSETGIVEKNVAFTDGVGSGQVNIRWGSSRSLGNTANETLDLSLLAETISGENVTRELSNIKLLVITNTHASNSIRVGAAASNAFVGPLGGTTPTIDVPPGASLPLVHPGVGWTVDSTHKNLKIANLGGSTTTYTILVEGVDEAGLESSSSSE